MNDLPLFDISALYLIGKNNVWNINQAGKDVELALSLNCNC